jgi:formate hydrogenlyase subunit 4
MVISSSTILRAANAVALLVMPFLLVGVLNRTKSLWSGRRGPPLLQPLWDVLRLVRKRSVYSETTTPLFRIGPWVFLLTTIGSAAVTPLLGAEPLVSFPLDFVWFAYVWALGRVATMMAALDTGSSFEGMGAAREATFSTLLEPALFLVAGALCLGSGARSLAEILVPRLTAGGGSLMVWLGSVVTLFIVLQVESARLPVDDPTTHLELTMVHEVMVLDHSGPDLAAIQTGAAMKLYVAAAVVATLLNPWAGKPGPLAAAGNVGLCLGIAIAVGTIESLIARLRLRTVPKYIAVALASAAIALLATGWRDGVVAP